MFSADICKKRLRNMRDTCKKHKRDIKMGTGSASQSRPRKWALADALSFLDAVHYERQ
jgi:hypothetical protein